MLYQSDISATLQSIPWFLDLKPRQINALTRIASIVQLNSGEVLFNEDDKTDALYILLQGQMSLEYYVPTHGGVCIFIAEPLDIVGWCSMTPVVRQRSATSRANIASILLFFNAESLRELCDLDHDIGYVIMRRLANVVASRLLTTRLCLVDIIANPQHNQST
jgi:CRP/FNR family transcriptional regulator, cyclic AMP receptor protein